MLLLDLKNLHVSMVPAGVDFVFEIASDVPERVCLDSLRIQQLLSNGLTNAIKVTFEFSAVIIAPV